MFTVKVAFTREKDPDFVSKRIMDFLDTDYSHCFFINDGFIYHATGEGVNRCHLDVYLEDHVIVHEVMLPLPLMTEDSFKAYMRGADAKEYGHLQYAGFIAPWAQKLVRNGNAKQICSELIAEIARDYGNLKLPKEQDFMSPKDVLILLSDKTNLD